MFKVGVRVPFEYGIEKFLYVFDNTKIVSNLPDSVSEWKMSWGIPERWRERLPDVVEVALEELKMTQKMVLEFFQSHSLKWYVSNEEGRRCIDRVRLHHLRQVSGHQLKNYRRLSLINRGNKHTRRDGPRRRVVYEEHGPTTSREVDERLARKEEAYLRMALALSREDAYYSNIVVLSPETPTKPVQETLVEPFQILSIQDDTSAQREVAFRHGEGTLEATVGQQAVRQGVEEEALWGRRLLSRRRVEAMVAPAPRPFDVEARALKFLDDLLLIESRDLWESDALGQAAPLDGKGRRVVERMLLEFLLDVWRELTDLEERVHFIDGYASQAEYRYHVLKEFPPTNLRHHHAKDLFGVSHIMDGEEHQRLGSFMSIMSEDHKMAEEELEARLERYWTEGMTEEEWHFFFQLLEMGWRAQCAEAL
ncbi:hypothetical protein ACLOJK_019148 [Asimina triloba]